MVLYVGNLNFDITEEQIKELFESVGDVNNVVLKRDKDSGQSKGFGFVHMRDTEEAVIALKTLNGREFFNRNIVVNFGNEPTDNKKSGSNQNKYGDRKSSQNQRPFDNRSSNNQGYGDRKFDRDRSSNDNRSSKPYTNRNDQSSRPRYSNDQQNSNSYRPNYNNQAQNTGFKPNPFSKLDEASKPSTDQDPDSQKPVYNKRPRLKKPDQD